MSENKSKGVVHSYAMGNRPKKKETSPDAIAPRTYKNSKSKKVTEETDNDEEVLSKDRSLTLSYHYRALLDKAIYEEATSKLVPTEHVRQFLTVVGSKIRTLLVQMPDRLSSRIVHESDEETIHLLLFREVEQISNSIIEEMSEQKFLDVLASSAKDPVIRSRKIAQSHKGKENVQDVEDDKE